MEEDVKLVEAPTVVDGVYKRLISSFQVIPVDGWRQSAQFSWLTSHIKVYKQNPDGLWMYFDIQTLTIDDRMRHFLLSVLIQYTSWSLIIRR